MRLLQPLMLVLLASTNLMKCAIADDEYLIGAGIGDITGPAADVNLMGYANPLQIVHGIHIRVYSRAYIFVDRGNPSNRFVFVNVDAAMISQIVKTKVSEVMQTRSQGLYNERNIMLSATHSHSAPGGFHAYLLFDITSLGFVNQTYQAMVKGIVESIDMAHKSLQPASLLINSGPLKDSNINRSPTSYLVNPKEEIAKYEDGDTDKEMVVLKIVSSSGPRRELGMISWFPVHGTSMNNTNQLISGDNKGYAEQLFEKMMNPDQLTGKGPFVAAFSQANEGDVSPNTAGPKCINTGEPCDILHSTCGGKNKNCIAFGPGKDMVESTRIIGLRQFQKAKQLYDEAKLAVTGPVHYVHQFLDMSNQTVSYNSSSQQFRTCKPAMGYSFAAGTTDGPGAFDFTQGSTHTNPFWNLVRDFLKKPTEEQVKCHHPKPILLDTGEIKFPYPWQPSIVETQVGRVGSLIILAVPGEFSTMAGRRLREIAIQSLKKAGEYVEGKTKVVVAGLSNTYSDYITTYEEYQEQRYEAASTIFGPHTLQAYVQQYQTLVSALAVNKTVPPGTPPPDFRDKLISFVPGVLYDNPIAGKSYGDVTVPPQPVYARGDLVSVRFVSANPRNNLRQNSTFLTVEMFANSTQTWKVVYTDADWETKFHWFRSGVFAEIAGTSEADVQWQTSSRDQPGMYRIRHFLAAKHAFSGKISEFQGVTNTFIVK